MPDPINLGARRVAESCDPRDWTPLDMLQEAVQKIRLEEGPSSRAILILIGDDDCTISITRSKLSDVEAVGYLHFAQDMLTNP